VVAASVTVVLMFTLALAIATAQDRLVTKLRAHVADVKRWGGIILVLVGLWLFALTVFADFFAEVFPV
jgi:cytochrome c biogenesis protein CcdA